MKITNKKFIALFLTVLSILIIKDVNALGISPGTKTIDFEPNLDTDVTLTVFNNEHKDFTAAIFTRGELKDYVELKEDRIKLSAEDNEKSFNYIIKLPESLEKPGMHQADIVVREIAETEEGGDIVIGALVAVVSQLNVRVPFPGKYATANLDILSAKPNEEVKFFIRVSNLGEENIENATAKITILDKNSNEVVKIFTNSKEIKSKERKELIGSWKADVNAGEYRAVVVVCYDNLETVLEAGFVIGDFFLMPLDISVKNFKLGQIAKFNILVENIANREIRDVAAQLLLFDENEDRIMDIKSAQTEIQALSKKELIAYWDTENVETGTYVGKIILSYEGKTLERQIRTTVTEDEIKTEIVGITAFAVAPTEAKLEKGSILSIIIKNKAKKKTKDI